MVMTSHQDLMNTDSKTGLWIGEFADPYYEFIDQGYEIVLASPLGGKPPIDPLSKLTENITASNRRFTEDEVAKKALSETRLLEEVEASEFDAVFFPGGHGPLFDLANSDICGQLILDFYKQKKPIAAVCHGPAALIKAVELEPAILKGKRVTGFSDAEEKLVFRENNIPFTVENRLVWLGGDYHNAVIPFSSHVEQDGLLITGQNPLSAVPAAKTLIELLEARTDS
ncbi:type 1 glutamine amidotransferase domain-containing protein [Subsaximicrobium wynnwilliamsii]|uniref:Type 1 glutamine amidotransferase domain-containing protein n=2 Tax=Subsaximicrobium wynnwilliamsii TaxID=291179 RepID=A0A5C6ZJJ3_9FLAO|nr:type 1 glutamine amidotransferase domain-containing protein [Subsaximicrobium wynnwilliamsii]TXD89966.1 type 1 glutamine amidotransferase domain-containing protein [Subsaximicrobium wynnwilliamsii]TXE01057.1 type 1 glutamine amidotransferase domain-containing protein [Subsaximicrobium wynnwilliamsii]